MTATPTPQMLKELNEAEPIKADIPAHAAFSVLAHLQLALRHPGASGPGSRLARQAALDLQNAIAKRCPSLRDVMEQGWNPEHDVPSKERPQ